jgi:hypothetical protein
MAYACDTDGTQTSTWYPITAPPVSSAWHPPMPEM